jgi:hypothetical protein
MIWLFIDPVLMMVIAFFATKFFEGGSEVYGVSKVKGLFMYATGGIILVVGFCVSLKFVTMMFLKAL